MKIEEFFDLKICTIEENEREDEGKFSTCDIVWSDNLGKKDWIKAPPKITWKAYLDNYSSPIEFIKSKKFRKSIRFGLDRMENLGIKLVQTGNLSKRTFQDWFDVYREEIRKKPRGRMALSEDWLENKLSQGKKVGGVFLYKKGRLFGGNLHVYVGDKLVVGYGIAKRINEVDIGLIMDYYSLKDGFDKGYKVVSFGQDRNLYGYHLSSGLFSYKSRLGLTPGIPNKCPIMATKIVSFRKLDKITIILSVEEKKLFANVFWRDIEPDEKEFAARGIESVRLIPQTSVEAKS